MVTISIKKRGEKVALVTFHISTNKFRNLSERSKFFERLYGRRQTIKRGDKVYEYHREGLLNPANHIKVDNSVFIVAMERLKQMEDFFKEWEDKVMFKTFPVLLDEDEVKKELGREVEIE